MFGMENTGSYDEFRQNPVVAFKRFMMVSVTPRPVVRLRSVGLAVCRKRVLLRVERARLILAGS